MTQRAYRLTTRTPSATAVVAACIMAAVVVVPLVALAQEGGSDATIPTYLRNKWTITVKGKAQTAGEFTMMFKTQNEDPKEFTVRVVAKMSAKEIAKDIWKELALVAGDRYKVKNDGNKVVVKTNTKKDPPCGLQMKQQNLAGASILIKGD